MVSLQDTRQREASPPVPPVPPVVPLSCMSIDCESQVRHCSLARHTAICKSACPGPGPSSQPPVSHDACLRRCEQDTATASQDTQQCVASLTVPPVCPLSRMAIICELRHSSLARHTASRQRAASPPVPPVSPLSRMSFASAASATRH